MVEPLDNTEKKDEIIKELKTSLPSNSTLGRLALSKSICRFELPMDIKQFETLTPLTYLERYCRVKDRRKVLYKKIFDKYKLKQTDNRPDCIDLKLLEECLMDVHMRSINKEQIELIYNLVGINEHHHNHHKEQPFTINFQLFVGLAAFSERILYDHFVTADTRDLPEYQKDKIESADFEKLGIRLEGVKISSKMLRLLNSL